MRNEKILLILIIIFSHFSGFSQDSRTITLDFKELQRLKKEVISNQDILYAKNKLLAKCRQILADKKMYSVTFNFSGSPLAHKNDYISKHAYMWPNPETKSGFPFIHIDGKVNRYSEEVSDRPMLEGLERDILHLGLAYFYTEDEKYVKWATTLLECFFVNPSTKMNPNFNFSQITPGNWESGGSIMEAVVLINVIEGIQLLKSSDNFSPELSESLNNWFRQFFIWLEESPKGKINAKNVNNRGTYYTLFRCDIAMFLNDRELAADIFQNEAFNRVTDQISREGALKAELKRSRPLGYVKYNLKAFQQLNKIGETLGFDLLNYKGPHGESLKNAFEWLDKYKRGETIWHYSFEDDISTYRRSRMKASEETYFRFSLLRYNTYLDELTSYF